MYFWTNSFTPHARGSTAQSDTGQKPGGVYPACAGIDLAQIDDFFVFCGLPRMRGDRPQNANCASSTILFTPHARGSTLIMEGGTVRLPVYPACAGIDPPSPSNGSG